ncbi:MAG: DUF3307 domain-containing protein [Firmicutes bacterium]|nr:DUF3307 domain-containing protein [Bacillota bacterium]
MAGLVVALKLLVAHFAADFLLQTWPVAAKKGKRLKYLLVHVATLLAVTVLLFAYELGSYLTPILILALCMAALTWSRRGSFPPTGRR